MSRAAAVILAALACALSAAAADDKGATNRTVITSDRLSFDYKRSIAVFEGNVVAVDPQLTMKADSLTVVFDKQNQVKSATGSGNVHLTSGDKAATCRKAVYLADTGEIVLIGDVVATMQSGATNYAPRMTFNVRENTVSSESGHLVIPPNEEKTRALKKDSGAQKPGGKEKRTSASAKAAEDEGGQGKIKRESVPEDERIMDGTGD